ncbi:MAG: hypothetical protein ACJATP_003754 [Candidatus Azotimanducaceae bacterium]|jgi:hypothetical protein
MVAGDADDSNACVGEAVNALAEIAVGFEVVFVALYHIAGKGHHVYLLIDGQVDQTSPGAGGSKVLRLTDEGLGQP